MLCKKAVDKIEDTDVSSIEEIKKDHKEENVSLYHQA